MYKSTTYLFLSLLVISCSYNEVPFQEQKTTVVKKKKTEVKKEEESDKFTTENAVEKLTQYGIENPETKAVIKTSYGNIYILLYKDTPLHRASFVMLAKRNFYDSTLFYRVHKNFVIQGGNSDSEETLYKFWEIGTYRIPPEISSKHYHKKGAIALAVPDNPEDTSPGYSSPYNFYIVQGNRFSERSLSQQEKEYGFKVPTSIRETYFKIGGAPHLDGKYTVFGEVTRGFDVIDKIANLPTNVSDFPLESVYLSVEILK
jgi:cyclophilin family peptidyl-prolyl cis-trans isomerase